MKFLGSEKASAEMVGQVMLIGLTVMAIGTITLMSAPAIFNLQDMMSVNNVERGLTMFDSRAGQVIFGDVPRATIVMNLGSGSLAIDPNSTKKRSYITIKTDKEIKIPMGKVTYSMGSKIVSYEGGGIWLKSQSGGSTMLSPPKMDYNGITFTLPVISMTGEGFADKGTAAISFNKNSTSILYPDAGTNMTNPVNAQAIYVNITSEFYDAWADYAKSLGYSTITQDPSTSTTSLKLSSVPANLGGTTEITNPINLRGLDPASPAPLNNYSFRLVPYGSRFDWDIHASSGKKKLIFHIKGKADNAGSPVDINVGYQEDGAGFTKPVETWAGSEKLFMQGQNGNLYLDVNLLDKNNRLWYNQTNVGAGTFDISSKSFNNSPNGFSWPNTTSTINTTRLYKWTFDNDTESWTSNYTTNNGSVTMGLNSTDKSIYSKLELINKTAVTTWTSPGFLWSNGTPSSARLDFDWKVATMKNANPGSFYAMLVKPNGSTSQIYPTTTFDNITSNWTQLNATIPPGEFGQNGTYRLKLMATLNTKSNFSFVFTEEVGWDNPSITLNSTTYAGSQLTEKSLYDITQHYIQKMAQDGDISFYQSYAPGKGLSAGSTMLLNYNSTSAPIYLFVSQNTADVSIN